MIIIMITEKEMDKKMNKTMKKDKEIKTCSLDEHKKKRKGKKRRKASMFKKNI